MYQNQCYYKTCPLVTQLKFIDNTKLKWTVITRTRNIIGHENIITINLEKNISKLSVHCKYQYNSCVYVLPVYLSYLPYPHPNYTSALPRHFRVSLPLQHLSQGKSNYQKEFFLLVSVFGLWCQVGHRGWLECKIYVYVCESVWRIFRLSAQGRPH